MNDASSHSRAAESRGITDPIVVEVTRGPMVESWHRGAFAVSDPDGKIVLHAGDFERPVYPRSAIKPLQALALVETGAAEAFALGDAEIALACASHGGEPRHVDTVAAWLARIGCGPADLECGAHLPSNESAMVALLKSGRDPSALHNNCSGKHSGFLSVARHLGQPTAGYIKFEHPVQQRILGILESMAGCELGAAPRGTDGCGIPTLGIPLGNIALAMARLADPADQPEPRQAAAARIRRAMAAEPFMVAGSGRFCTRVMELTGAKALIKGGAEGVYCGILPELGLGIALKVDDGAGRGAEVVMGQLLRRLGVLGEGEIERLGSALAPPVLNRAGLAVGEVRGVADSPF
ncbi:MAG: asparaginase [Rhodospirillales bacterium]|nr:asparaginase [Rhodospirillales bacterium]